MKKTTIISFCCAIISITACSSSDVNTTSTNESNVKPADTNATNVTTNENLNADLLAKGNEVLQTLDPLDISKLCYNVHPSIGLYLSPYPFLDTLQTRKFKGDELLNLLQSNKKTIWGEYDGSGEPIELNVTDYFNRFVYDQNYRNAPQVEVDETIGIGNSINNCTKVFPNAHFVEYHFKGFEPSYEGMDWKSIRLVFKTIDENLYLIAIIHDEWTI